MTLLFIFLTVVGACQPKSNTIVGEKIEHIEEKNILPGIYSTSEYLPKLKGKKVAAVVNHTSMINDRHLVDSLIDQNVDLRRIFSPEHGFKGTAYNGEEIADGMYRGKIPISSLYGKTKKPQDEDLKDIDVIIFDIQDVGARFYTYISTLHYVLEAAAKNDIEVMILDRPNPNGHYVDGPLMEDTHKSFVGMHNVPVVYGMTIGEYGLMINGEEWLGEGVQCVLQVIRNTNYTHQSRYVLPIPPSPNLPNERAVLLYPSLCFLEGTVMNEGRGTSKQFQVYGHPMMDKSMFRYTPVSMSSSKYPKQQDKVCGGVDLSTLSPETIRTWEGLNLSFLIDSYQKVGDQEHIPFFLANGWINKLAGTAEFKKQIEGHRSIGEMRKSWQPGLDRFKKIRAKYLLYP